MVSFVDPSVEALVVTAGATLTFNCVNAPDEVDNGGMWEWTASAFLSIAPLASLLTGGRLVDGLLQCMPYFKLSFTFVYAAAAFAKLNWDFLNFRTSSNTVFLVKLLASPPFLGSDFGLHSKILPDGVWILLLCIALLLLETAEILIPVLFWINQPQLGAAVNWLFHLFVGAAAYNFSCSGTGSLPFVLAQDALVDGLGFMTVSLASRLVALGIVAALVLSQSPKPGAPDAYNRVHGLCSMQTGSFEKSSIHGTWLVWALILAIGLTRQCTRHISDDMLAAYMRTLNNPAVHVVSVLITVALLLTCLAPYLGLKTHSTFSMFSNLRVEGNSSNHLLFRAWMQPFGLLKDMVIVTATNHDRIRFFMRRVGGPDTCGPMRPVVVRLSLGCAIFGQLKKGRGIAGSDETNTVFPYAIPYIQLRSLVAETTCKDFIVEYTRAGAHHRFVLRDGEVWSGDERLRHRLPIMLRPWIFCRAVQSDDNRGLCYH